MCCSVQCPSMCRWVSTSSPWAPRSPGFLCRCTQSHNPQEGSAHCGSVRETRARRGHNNERVIDAPLIPVIIIHPGTPLQSLPQSIKPHWEARIMKILSELMGCHTSLWLGNKMDYPGLMAHFCVVEVCACTVCVFLHVCTVYNTTVRLQTFEWLSCRGFHTHQSLFQLEFCFSAELTTILYLITSLAEIFPHHIK